MQFLRDKHYQLQSVCIKYQNNLNSTKEKTEMEEKPMKYRNEQEGRNRDTPKINNKEVC